MSTTEDLFETETKNPARAAIKLRDGAVVDYQPGDGTRYECVLAHRVVGRAGQLEKARERWLIVRNLKICLDITKPIDPIDFCLASNTHGCWAALRPVLAVLGALREPGSHDYDPADAQREAAYRVSYDGGPLNHRDARLGSLIRRQVEAGG